MRLALSRLILHNFGVYRGCHVIELTTGDEGRPVVLVGALNGSGKTTIIEALQVGLYGEQASVSRRGRSGYQEYLRGMINRDAPRKEGASVTIEFSIPDHGEYSVTRTWSISAQSVKESVEASRDGDPDVSLSERWQEEIERLFPQRLCNLFFFDGEQIEALADPAQTASVLKTAISALLGLELIDQAERDLAIVARQSASERKESEASLRLEEIEQRLSDINSQFVRIDAESAFIASDIAAKGAELRVVEEQFSAQGGDLYQRARTLERARSELEIRIGQIESEMRQLASGPIALRMISAETAQLKDSGSAAAKAREAKIAALEITRVKSQVLDAVASASVGDNVIRNISTVFDREIATLEERSSGTECFGLEHRDLDLLDGLDQVIGSEKQRATELAEELRGLQEQLIETNQQLAAVPEESAIAAVLEQRSRLQAEIELGRSQKATLDEQLTGLMGETERLKQEMERIAKEQAESEELSERNRNRVKVALDARERLAMLKAEMLNKHIAAIEKKTFECYSRLLRKKSLIEDVKIDPDTMQISLINMEGHQLTPGRFSAGERQLLATAILWALASLSSNQLPVVIDTPLGRLDSDHRANLVQEYFPHASHQVVLLSTDEEIDGRYYKMLSATVGRTITLEYSDSDRSTLVKDGYFLGEAA